MPFFFRLYKADILPIVCKQTLLGVIRVLNCPPIDCSNFLLNLWCSFINSLKRQPKTATDFSVEVLGMSSRSICSRASLSRSLELKKNDLAPTERSGGRNFVCAKLLVIQNLYSAIGHLRAKCSLEILPVQPVDD